MVGKARRRTQAAGQLQFRGQWLSSNAPAHHRQNHRIQNRVWASKKAQVGSERVEINANQRAPSQVRGSREQAQEAGREVQACVLQCHREERCAAHLMLRNRCEHIVNQRSATVQRRLTSPPGERRIREPAVNVRGVVRFVLLSRSTLRLRYSGRIARRRAA